MKQSPQGCCTGMTQRDGMGREVGTGCSGWGTHVQPMADSCQCMAKLSEPSRLCGSSQSFFFFFKVKMAFDIELHELLIYFRD